MRINKKEINNSVSFEKKQTNSKKNSLEQKSTKAQSLDALDSYGRAMVNFGSKNIDAADFEKRKNKLQEILSEDYNCAINLFDKYERELYEFCHLTIKLPARDRYLNKPEFDCINEENIKLAEEICFDKELDFPKGNAFLFLNLYNNFKEPEEKEEFKNFIFDLLKNDKILYGEEKPMLLLLILSTITNDNFQLVKKAFTDEELNMGDAAYSFIINYNAIENDEMKEKYKKFIFNFCKKAKDIPEDNRSYYIGQIIENLKTDDIDLAQELLFDDETKLPIKMFSRFLEGYKKLNTEEEKKQYKDFVFEVLATSEKSKNKLWYILPVLNKNNIEIVRTACITNDDESTGSELYLVLKETNEENFALAERLCKEPNLGKLYYTCDLKKVLCGVNHENCELVTQLFFDEELDFPKSAIDDFVENYNKCQTQEEKEQFKDFVFDFLKVEDIPQYEKSKVLQGLDIENLAFVKTFLEKGKTVLTRYDITDILKAIKSKAACDFAIDLFGEKYKGISNYHLAEIIKNINEENLDLANMLCDQSTRGFDSSSVGTFLFEYNQIDSKEQKEKCRVFVKKLVKDTELSNWQKSKICSNLNEENLDLAFKIYFSEGINAKTALATFLSMHNSCETESEKRELAKVVFDILEKLDAETLRVFLDSYEITMSLEERKKYKDYVFKLWEDKELPRNAFLAAINKQNNISQEEIRKALRTFGKDKISALSREDVAIAAKLECLYKKKNINEIPLAQKRHILRKLVECSNGMFYVSDALKNYCPLIPTNQKEYCALLPAIVKSIGIETNEINEAQKAQCLKSVFELGQELKTITDTEFNSMKISQEYKKEDFIRDTFNIVKDLSKEERQKVFDYFGFELHHNENGTQVDENPNHSFVITGYPVNLNNGKKLAQIEDENTKKIVEQLRPCVIRFSENNHISSNIAKIEQALNEIVSVFPELRTMIDKKQHSAHSFDLMKHSLKVMQKIVQNPDYEKLDESDKKLMLLAAFFHDITKAEGYSDKTHAGESSFDSYYILKKLGLSRQEEIKFNLLTKNHEWLAYTNNNKISEAEKIRRMQSVAFDMQQSNVFDMAKIFTQADLKAVKHNDSFFERFKDAYFENSAAIQDNINILKASHPLFPVTKLPKASKIEKAVKFVNNDGSTNIKGVYKIDGNIVIRYNEVENWEELGFPKGTISKGIEGVSDNSESFNTGNIHFFVHGLDYPNQLIKFDAFELPNSDALLSVSYAERPESKNRFFRTQGVILDVDNEFAYGGGETDAGSGYSKDINEFKTRYTFGGNREKDREYISNLIKETLNLDDLGYIEFVKRNNNKSMLEIEPKEVREKLIKAFASINSNKRRGDRAYNEMYLSNPRVMGVFAYPIDTSNQIGNTKQFMDRQANFLKEYAKEYDLPFVIFGI